jgi:signal transduction histidine kinase
MRNKEFRHFLLTMLFTGAVLTSVSFLFSVAAGIAAAACSAVFLLLAFAYTHQRYAQIKRLCEYLKRINNGNYSLDVRDNAEGELSILKNEIYKVTVALRERGDLLQREKASLADALSDISHQLKTPLTSMLIMTDLLCDVQLPDDRRQAFTSRMRLQIERLQWLVSSLLKMSRLDAKTVKFNTCHIPTRNLIERACAPLLIPAELKNHTVTVDAGEAIIACDENWTAEALLNVLKNCVEHTPEGGAICVTCEENPLFTQIRVSDTGPGIDAADLPHIFSRFYRGKNASEDSAGIGLAMAAAIVKEQGGSITAASSPRGSVFTLRLPKYSLM